MLTHWHLLGLEMGVHQPKLSSQAGVWLPKPLMHLSTAVLSPNLPGKKKKLIPGQSPCSSWVPAIPLPSLQNPQACPETTESTENFQKLKGLLFPFFFVSFCLGRNRLLQHGRGKSIKSHQIKNQNAQEIKSEKKHM